MGEQYYPVFNILKVGIEKQIGRELKTGGLYHITGVVEGAFDFDIHRVVKNYIRMVTPLEYRDKVEFGRVYDVCIKSIEEVQLNEKQREIVSSMVGIQYRPLMYRLERAKPTVGRPHEPVVESSGASLNKASSGSSKSYNLDGLDSTFDPVVRLQSGRDPRLYFRIHMSAFCKKTGIRIEEGGFYRIGIRIEGVGSFQKTLRSVAARQDIPFYVPAQLRDKLVVGRVCKVHIESFEELPRPNDWRTGQTIDASTWTWREIASWTDTEGAIRTYLSIGQKDQRVIREICAFFDKNGIQAIMRLDRHTGVYYAIVTRMDEVAKAIVNIEPFIRTANKKVEIQHFTDYIAKPRRRLKTSIVLARKILAIAQD